MTAEHSGGERRAWPGDHDAIHRHGAAGQRWVFVADMLTVLSVKQDGHTQAEVFRKP